MAVRWHGLSAVCWLPTVLGPLGCRSHQALSEPIAATSNRIATSAVPAKDIQPGGDSKTNSATDSALPHLKPTSSKPFPDGPEDHVLCAAIHSGETNLWERFGHFIPMFWDGVIWVGEGTEQDLKATMTAIAAYAPRLFLAEGRACSRGGVLLYVDDLRDGYEDSLRTSYSIKGLEDAAVASNPIVKRTMARRFVIDGTQGRNTHHALCALDAEQCDAQLRLRGRFGEYGLCNGVESLAKRSFANPDRSWATTPRAADPSFRLDTENELAEFRKRCEGLPALMKVCAALPNRESSDCWSRLAKPLGY